MLNLIDHLPRNSHFVEAQLGDAELAEVIAGRPRQPAREAISEWSPERDTLVRIYDRLGDVIRMLARADVNLPQHPRPTTAVDAVRQRQRREKHLRLVAMVLPDQN